ncbi:MAG: hypothetical protein HC831_29800, partial [Chloroflexia bacterium]|nr:hypothetical protein [Chloroflexia bacterium]
MLFDLSEKLGPLVTSRIGEKVILAGKDIFIKEQGFDTIEKLFKGYPDMFDKTIVGYPPTKNKTYQITNKGHVIMHY